MSATATTAPVAPAAPTRGRKLHVGHFAFMRAVVQGLDPRESWERYLGAEGDVTDQRVVRSTIAWIRDEFAAAAKREDRHGTARLVQLDATRIADPGLDLPSLAAFAEAQGLQDEREADQIAAYEAVYGAATQRLRRRARLITRQLEALRWLEGLVAQPPRPGDALAAWLNPTLASHLHVADIFTLAQLVDRINGVGQRWYSGIKGLGALKAQRIVQWLQVVAEAHPDSAGLAIGRHVGRARSQLFTHELQAVVQPATDIRPLEKFIVPVELDGSQGLYRRPQAQCLLKARNDHQAILAWLQSKHGLTPEQKAQQRQRRRQRDAGVEQGADGLQGLSPMALSNTQRAYRKEAERFLLWAIVQQGKPLSSMTHEDCLAYRDFLADPQPRSRWCGQRARERWSPLWRPFEGPLSPAAQQHTVTVLKNLYSFLVDQNYLMGNPWASVSVPRTAGPKVDAGRSLSRAQMALVEQQLSQLPDTSRNQRLAFALPLLYATGLRLSEVVAATVDDLEWVEYPGGPDEDAPVQGWMLKVIGKGRKLREVPLPVDVVASLSRYLVARGLVADPQDIGNQGAHLLGQASDAAERGPRLKNAKAPDPRRGVAASTLYDQIKAFFADCAAVLRRAGDTKDADRFERASTHWLRHTHASHAIASGMPLEVAQQNLGHASLATTTVYVTTEKRRRMKAVEAFWRK